MNQNTARRFVAVATLITVLIALPVGVVGTFESIDDRDFTEGCDKIRVMKDGEAERVLTPEKKKANDVDAWAVFEVGHEFQYRCNGDWQSRSPSADDWYEFLESLRGGTGA